MDDDARGLCGPLVREPTRVASGVARNASRIPGVLVMIALSAAAPAATVAQDRPWDGWGMHPMGGMWGLWTLWGLAMMVAVLAFWGLVIAGLIIGLRRLLRWDRERDQRGDAALDILRQRYARGEISKEEYDARRRDLTAGNDRPG
jgi:putative membrane protein